MRGTWWACLCATLHGGAVQSLLLHSHSRRRAWLWRSPRRTTIPTMAMSPSSARNAWTELGPDSLVSAPCLVEQTLCHVQPNGQKPQLAGTYDYARAILDAWRDEQARHEAATTQRIWHDVQWQRVTYVDCHGTMLHGHVLRTRPHSDVATTATDGPTRVIVLFGTAAGPHDVFLLWKAVSLLNTLDLNSNSTVTPENVWILIADVLSDATGWGWNVDRTRYTMERTKLLQHEISSGRRTLLQDRIQAALDYIETNLVAASTVPSLRLAVLGWCLGGHAVAELGRMMGQCTNYANNAAPDAVRRDEWTTCVPLARISGMVTFHGVFAGLESELDDSTESTRRNGCEILLCHGVQDPLVPPSDVEAALALFQRHGHTTALLQLPAKHGFTNPAQEFNPQDAFGYHAESAQKAWRQTLALLRRRL